MEIPKGCKVNAKGDYVLQILWNIYGQKQAGCIWFLHLVKKLKSIGFIQLTTSPCIFVRKNCIYVLYTDDSLLTGPQHAELLRVVEDMKAVQLKITVKGTIADFLGVNIKRDRHTFRKPQQLQTGTKTSRSLPNDNEPSRPKQSSTKIVPFGEHEVQSRCCNPTIPPKQKPEYMRCCDGSLHLPQGPMARHD